MTTTAQTSSPRAAIVTGATSGIGEATTRALHAEGYRVLLTGRSQSRGEALARELGSGAHFYPEDLTESDAATRVAEAALAFAGRLDVLVNNAGIDHTGDILTAPMEEIRAVFETNTFGTMAMLQAAGKVMKILGEDPLSTSPRDWPPSASRRCPCTQHPKAPSWL
ncbi:NAD(P)-dependent dehydrogenase (short-subunit alcohol dehydrogenase family) [Paenarthrobacter sp. TE4293]|uniref:SDR family oxidoreductase n=1 Tax=Paenarthrobacter sp. TE4293 TaxID=3381695 RepID=UPI003D1FE46A